jgi:hypothetical protein
MVTRELANKEIAISDDFADSLMDAVLMSGMMVVLTMAMLPVLVRMTEQSSTFIQSQMYAGNIDPRVLNADENMKWLNLIEDSPYTPWVAADFYNYGPDKAYIGINTPGPWSELENGEGLQVSMIGATRRIEAVFYKCDTDKRARVKVDGKY